MNINLKELLFILDMLIVGIIIHSFKKEMGNKDGWNSMILLLGTLMLKIFMSKLLEDKLEEFKVKKR